MSEAGEHTPEQAAGLSEASAGFEGAAGDAAPAAPEMDIEALLKEYDDASSPNPAEAKPETTEDYSDLEAAIRLRNMENTAEADRLQWLSNKVSGEMNALALAKFQEAFNRDLSALVKQLRGDLDPSVFTDEFVGAWLDAKARNLPELQKAFLGRETAEGAKAFARAARTLEKEFAQAMKPITSIDHNVTDDRMMIAAAMRGASADAPQEAPPDFARMSNRELNEWSRNNVGFDPGL